MRIAVQGTRACSSVHLHTHHSHALIHPYAHTLALLCARVRAHTRVGRARPRAVRFRPDGAVRFRPDSAVRFRPDGAVRFKPDGAVRFRPDGG